MRAPIADDGNFISIVERSIDPGEVGTLFFFQQFKRLLPPRVFKRLLERTSRRTPRMGFVIDPYSLFLFFPLKDLDAARAMLPSRYELCKAGVFEGDEQEFFLGMGVFNARASTFWGTRHESYLVARDTKTGLLSWIFIDILSDTLIAVPTKGVADPNTERAVFTINAKGVIHLDIAERGTGRRLKLKCDINGGTVRKPDQMLWIMGNTSIAHCTRIAGDREDPFAVIFDPAEVESGIDIPPGFVSIEENTLFPGLAEDRLIKAACFPYAQHYVADSPGRRTPVKDPDDMVAEYARIATLPSIETFSARGIERVFLVLTALFPVLSLLLLVLLLST